MRYLLAICVLILGCAQETGSDSGDTPLVTDSSLEVHSPGCVQAGLLECGPGKCEVCCLDSDCGAGGKCIVERGSSRCAGTVDGCGGCSAPYPLCLIVGVQFECVNCLDDSDCGGECRCSGAPEYMCKMGDGTFCVSGK